MNICCASSSMDRALDYGSRGWGFESLLARNSARWLVLDPTGSFFFFDFDTFLYHDDMKTIVTEVVADTPEKLGEAIRLHRTIRRLTQQQLADLSGVTRPAIVRIEAGAPATRISSVLAVMRVLGMQLPTYFVGEDERW